MSLPTSNMTPDEEARWVAAATAGTLNRPSPRTQAAHAEKLAEHRRRVNKRTLPRAPKPNREGCVHHWLLGTPTGPVTQGRCKKCGEEREYPSWEPAEAWSLRK